MSETSETGDKSTASAHKKGSRVVVRASAAQTAVLKAAYAHSSEGSSDQIKLLAEEIGLTSRWIAQWFGRQRAKDRRSKEFLANSASASIIGSEPPRAMSTEEILGVKLEHRDPLVPSDSTNSKPLESSFQTQVFLEPFDYRHIGLSQSGSFRILAAPNSAESDLNHRPLSVLSGTETEEIPRLRRKPGQRKRNPKARANGVRQDAPALPAIEREVQSTIASLRYTPDPTEGPSNSDYRASNRLYPPGVPDFVTNPNPSLLKAIAPAKRSPIPTSSNDMAGKASRSRLSGLSQLESSFQLTISPNADVPDDGRPELVDWAEAPPQRLRPVQFRRDETQGQLGPASRSRFQNNVSSNSSSSRATSVIPGQSPVLTLANFGSSDIPGRNISQATAYPLQQDFNQQHTFGHPAPQALGPPFAWNYTNSDIPGTPTFSSSYYAAYEHELVPSSRVNTMHYNTTPVDVNVIDVPRAFVIPPSLVQAQDNTTHFTYSNETQVSEWNVLDPFHAPLKHLTGILGEFRDENGSYEGLLVQGNSERHKKLVHTLADPELLLNNPFEAAMGLSMLSRLGLL